MFLQLTSPTCAHHASPFDMNQLEVDDPAMSDDLKSDAFVVTEFDVTFTSLSTHQTIEQNINDIKEHCRCA